MTTLSFTPVKMPVAAAAMVGFPYNISTFIPFSGHDLSPFMTVTLQGQATGPSGASAPFYWS